MQKLARKHLMRVGRVTIGIGICVSMWPHRAFANVPGSVSKTSSTGSVASAICPRWKLPVLIGKLDSKRIDEASGFVLSRTKPRSYLINDSGSLPQFFAINENGSSTTEIAIAGFKPYDTEEIALGPCPGAIVKSSTSCLVIGDIGDNREKRKNIELVFVEEPETFVSEVKPIARIKLRYPDRPHNAEAMAIWPNGDIFLVTKEENWKGDARAAQIFKLPRAKYERAAAGVVLELERVGEIDITSLTKDKGFGAMITGMSVTRDGSRFVLLTYGRAIEFSHDLSSRAIPKSSDMKKGKDYGIVPLKSLVQQEAISYRNNDRDLIYTTEVARRIFSSSTEAPIMGIDCEQ